MFSLDSGKHEFISVKHLSTQIMISVPGAQLCKPRSELCVYRPLHHTTQCSPWPHTQHNLNSVSWQNNTEAINTHSLSVFLSLSLFCSSGCANLHLWFRTKILDFVPENKQTNKQKNPTVRQRTRSYFHKVKQWKQDTTPGLVMVYRCYTCELRLQ